MLLDGGASRLEAATGVRAASAGFVDSVAGSSSGQRLVLGFGRHGVDGGRWLLREEDAIDQAGENCTKYGGKPEEP
jgi:hypothetical protein